MSNHHRFALLVIFIALLCAALACTSDNPVRPEETSSSLALIDTYTRWVFEVRTDNLAVDSFQLADRPRTVVSSPGFARHLFAAFRDSVAVLELGQPAGQKIWPFPIPGGILVSRREQYVALLGTELYILRAPDWSVVYHDTTDIWSGSFSPDERSFYAVVPYQSSLRQVRQVQLRNGSATDIGWLPESWSLPQIIASQTQGQFYLMEGYGTYSARFLHVDIFRDTIFYSRVVQPGNGTMAVSPDEQFAYYTSPGQIITNESTPHPWPFIGVYDCRARQHLTDISTTGIYSGDSNPRENWMLRLQLTHDGRRLVASSVGGPEFLIVNTQTQTVETFGSLHGGRIFDGLTIHPSAH